MMRVPLVDLTRQNESIRAEVMPEVERVISSQRFVLGAPVADFEAWLADYCGVKHAIGVASGSDALFLAMRALKIGGGDRVITTPLTFVATAEAIARTGATPIFADVDETLNIDPIEVRKLLETHPDRNRIRAILPVHLFGRAADMNTLTEIAEAHRVTIVEDAAQAIGASCMIRSATSYVGSIGEASAFSFFPSKNLGAWGDGGAVTTNDEAIAARVRSLRSHGITNEESLEVGTNSRLDAIQAAVLRVKANHLHAWTDARVCAADRYCELLRSIAAKIVLPTRAALAHGHVFNQFVIEVLGDRRNQLATHLRERGIETRAYYQVPLHRHAAFRSNVNLPTAERASQSLLALPMFPEIAADEQAHVANAIEEALA
jgi:dTDP-4-amino-4,6-dideoxygalactose transaminase